MKPFTQKTLLMACAVTLLAAFTPVENPDDSVTPMQQLYVLKEIKPDLERIGIVWSTAHQDEELMTKIRRAGTSLNVELVLAEVGSLSDIAPQFRALVRDHKVQALWVIQDDDVLNSPNGRSFLIKNALTAGVPLLAPTKAWVDEGACVAMSKGEEGIGLIINKSAADALSLAVPEQYVARTQFLAAK